MVNEDNLYVPTFKADGRVRRLLIDPPFRRFTDCRCLYYPHNLTVIAGEDDLVYDADFDPKIPPRNYRDHVANYEKYINGLKNDDHEIWRSIDATLSMIKPEVVGITVIGVKYASALKVARIAADHGCEIEFGGPHATLMPEDFRDLPFKFRVPQNEPGWEFDPERPSRRNKLLDSELRPRYMLGVLITMYGCAYNCSFCCSPLLWNRKVIWRSLDAVEKEIDELATQWKIPQIEVRDDIFAWDPPDMNGRNGKVSRFGLIANMMHRRNIPFACNLRVNSVTPEVCRILAENGCSIVKIGVENPGAEQLGILNKTYSSSTAQNAARMLRDHGLKHVPYIIIGFPDETEEQMWEAVHFAESLDPAWITISILSLHPGSDLWRKVGAPRMKWECYDHKGSFNLSRLHNFTAIRDRIFEYVDNFNKSKFNDLPVKFYESEEILQ